jgi:surface antigen
MQQVFRAFPILALLLLAACETSPGPTPPFEEPIRPLTDVRGFIAAAAYERMSDEERKEAATAQFYALQYGRTGAPRSWAGDLGAAGEVVVGPPVGVNSLYCRNFTHAVIVGGQTFVMNGMACREEGAGWAVVPT